MRRFTTGIIGSFRTNRALRQWERLADYARTTNLENLRALQNSAKAIGHRVGIVKHITDARLARPVIGSTAMDLPNGTDWAGRPDLWAGQLNPSGHAPAINDTHLGQDVTLYHDCKMQMLSIRQIRNTKTRDLAPFGLCLDVYAFDGSFLSVVVKAPSELVDGLTKKHVLRLTIRIESERPIDVSTRLNLKHGPNTEQVSKEINRDQDASMAEFDLAYVPFNESRAEHIWFDIFFDSPSMNQITLRDLTVSRHIRSNI
ncbi:MAG: hypothetical protein ACI861_001055 [Paracoccaceae bacterium]|jgi:hypothetical protein